jgi:hypothetical protein
MNITPEAVLLAQQIQCLHHLFHDVILISACAGAEKETLNIVRTVKREGYARQFFWSVGERLSLAAAVYGIGTVIALMAAVVGIKSLEEADTPAILGECMANSGQWRLARREGGGTYVMTRSLS